MKYNKNVSGIAATGRRMSAIPSTKEVPHYAVCARCRIAELCQPVRLGLDARAALERVIRRRRTLKRGEYLFRTGDPYHAVSALCSGSAKSSVTRDDGSVQVLSFHFAGELVGLCGLGAQQHLCDAVALETSDVCEIPLGRLFEVVEQSPAVRQFMYRLFGEELEHQHQLMQPLVGRTAAAERLAAYLLSLVQRYESRGLPAREIYLSMSRHDIGNYLGLAKETVSRLFSRFEDDGLISVRARRLRVNDVARLTALADSSHPNA
ncbi:MAG: cyclic nucleotide-binding domain-containing protein [Gammaproteobacteria bacterium]|nr:MAG: cyclic nucleotide-binding domain-containing protein [Gammaproteobacteria bacterium]